ncbi:putative inner membrane transporter YedA [Paraburkholderia aspalathi]|jgi:drug/metabolite transporter (DMT)-like permease|uniref:Inner membrane transporter YedA n=1 Tax=Paraburkholderia aspalathi TaxID=1324617 RepID=A0ABM8T397_9BURK|nr:EamA family transporter [Paraburkholderia aspalathi]MCP2084928.1 drug/metabolite transporter (DMT)-like permease [Paraburkholderia sediminicola]MBK3823615.1 EamA family transporter [Paraburkholderia aspalathi]MBK3835461.1 EamA family transporter [Paraburkholderia aspalathi]MBK3865221.1 EamA family transporter [Paraburkholderia aspalathi]CAE6853703.1 putative inner membrane transporter YedA [Paraburkholderia aspalathi]
MAPQLPSRFSRGFPRSFPIRLPQSRNGQIALALAVVYLVWGSTYLAVHVALGSFPPLLLSGLRNLFAGIGLFIFAARRNPVWPSAGEIRNAGLVGTMLVGLSSGMLAYGMRTVGTGTAAVMVATVPLFATVIAAVAGRKIGRGEWFAVGLGLVGIAILSHGDTAPGSAGGSLAILCGALFWAGGAHLAGRLKLPSDLFLSTSLQIGLGGAMSTMVAWVSGERMMEVHFLPVLAFVYLMLVGTMTAYVAYGFLIRHTSPIIASSCMYVNPVVAVALGALLLGEPVTRSTVIATIVILASVGLSFWFDYRKKGLA